MATLIDARNTAKLIRPEELTPEAKAAEVDAATSLSRGWRSAGLTEQANQLLGGATAAYAKGDDATGKALEIEGRRTLAEARRWAPAVQNASDVHDLESAGQWAAGALGSGVRSTILPAVGGLAGGALGALATRSAAGAQAGSMLGSGLAGYNLMADETIGNAMMDPEIRAKRSAQEILDTGRVSGALQAPLEAVVPGMLSRAALGVGKRAAKAGIAATVGKEMAREAAGEAGTEFAQDLVGQGALNQLAGRDIGQLDYTQALNAAAAGAVAGGGMGAVGGAAHAIHGGLDATTDTVNDVRANPSKFVDTAAAALGKGAASVFNKVDDFANNVGMDRDRAAFTGPVRSEERDLEGPAFAEGRRPAADAYAARVLKNPNLYGESEVQAANEYLQHKDPFIYASTLQQRDADAESSEKLSAIRAGIEGDTKQSRMQADTAEKMKTAWDEDKHILADIWRKQGIDEGIIDKVSSAVEPEQQQTAVAIMSWVARGFKGADGEVLVPDALIRAYGENTPKLIANAYELATKQGVINDAEARPTYEDVKRRIEGVINTEKADTKLIWESMTPVAQATFKATVPAQANRIKKLALVARDLRNLTKREIDKQSDANLDSWFGPRKNDVLDHFYTERKKDGVYDANEGREVEEGDAAETMGATDYENPLSEGNASAQVDSKRSYVPYSRASEYFDTTDELVKGRMDARAKEEVGKRTTADDASSHGVKWIGLVDRELEKAAEAAGRELTADESSAVIDRLMQEHFNVRRPTGSGLKHEQAVKQYESQLGERVKQLNNRFKAMRVESDSMRAPQVNLTKEQVDSIRLKSLDRRSESTHPARGVIYLDDGTKGGYATTASNVLRMMFNVNDGGIETTKEHEGTAHELHDLLLTGLTSIINSDPKFTGRIGFRTEAGQESPTWMKKGDKLPGNLKLKTDKVSRRPVFVQEAHDAVDAKNVKEAQEKYPERTVENMLEEILTHKLGWLARDLKREAERFPSNLTKEQRRKIHDEVKAFYSRADHNLEALYDLLPDKSEYKQFRNEVLKAQDKYESTGDPRMVASIYESRKRNKWQDTREDNSDAPSHESDNVVPSERSTGMYESETSHREDNAANLGPKAKPIHRDERGFVNTSNTTMKAANMAGSESTIVGKSDPKEGGTTKVFDKVHDGGLSVGEVIADLKYGVPRAMTNLHKAIAAGKMDEAEATIRNLFIVSEMSEAQVLSEYDGVEPNKAGAIIQRAKEMLPRARAIVDQGGSEHVGDIEGSAQGALGASDVEVVRGQGDAAKVQVGPESDSSDRAVAGEVRGHEGVADGAAGRDARAGLKKWLAVAKTADMGAIKVQIGKMSRAQLDKLSEALHDHTLLDEIAFDRDTKGARRLVEIEDAIYDAYPSDTKESSVKADTERSPEERKAARKEAEAYFTEVLGDRIEAKFVKAFNDGSSGSWSKGATKNLIRIALNSNVLGTAYHESMHEFFDVLGKHGGATTQELLKRVATNKVILRQLSRLLDGHPEAQAQLSDPEEALAYMYQFWKAGQLKLGPETRTFMQKVSDFFKRIFGIVNEALNNEKDRIKANDIFNAFASGAMSGDDSIRQNLVELMNSEVEAHDKALKNVATRWNKMMDVAGKYVLSAEDMIERSDNKYMVKILRGFQQKTGGAMGERQAYFEAVSTARNRYMNRLENILSGQDPEDIELARKALSTGKTPTDPVAKEIVDKIRELQEDLFKYAREKDVSRWDDEKGTWTLLEHRKDYYPRVWDIDALMKDGVKFREKLLEVHAAELKAIAEKANKEIASKKSAGKHTASDKELKKPVAEQEEVTPEMVADAILSRLLNSAGYVELDESVSDLGMSPVATSVNRRTLSWINDEAFDDFKEKDLVRTMTSYVNSMVKRAEYTERFGHGGEGLRADADRAVLSEIGGEELVAKAEDALPEAEKAWRKSKAMDPNFDEPYPKLRSVGESIFSKMNGPKVLAEARAAAIKKLEQPMRAVMALEGTLGNDIRQQMRDVNSWMMTYQNFRLLSTSLFTSFSDVVGLVLNGGEVADAWDGFVRGIKEVKLRWGDKKSQDMAAQRAEMWGTVDAGSFMDALGQTYGSSMFSGAARRMSDALFKYNGMEAWNRAMRITATTVAERVIKQYKTEGFDKSDEAAVARFEELFGKDFKPEDIKLTPEGELDVTDLRNQAAVSKWVNNAILRPNAAERTIWGSDPHFHMIWHMKQFTYTFQNVILKKVVQQAALGNFRPALVAMVGYAPIIIAADAIKELLIPGDEPAWMKMGLAGMLHHGVDKAGLLGVGQMGYDSLTSDFGSGLTGPAISQVLRAPFDPAGETALGALPFGNLARRLAQ